jgi:hypothetical protein
VRLIADVEHDHAAIEIAHVHAVGPLGIDIGVVRAEAAVAAAGMALQRALIVAALLPRQPPAADLARL